MLIALAASNSPVLAGTNGTWTDTSSGGLWSATGNWSGGKIANGLDAIADFSTLDITTDNTVHLDSARTIGQLIFGDINPSNNWILDNNGNAANTLTFSVSSNNPQITVNTQTATLSLGITGTNVVKSGARKLVLSGTTDNTGLGMIVNAGTLVLAKSSSASVHAIGGGGLTVNGGTAQLGGNGGDQIYDSANVTVSNGAFETNGQSETFNNLSLAGTGISGAGALVNSASGSSVITPTTGTVLTGDTTIGVSQSSGSLTLSSTISGGFGITKVGSGTLTLQGSGPNSFTGATNVNDGTLVLDNPAGQAAVSGTVNIGDGIGAPGSAAVVEANNYQLSSGGASVAIQSDGVLNIQSSNENVVNLTMTGGSVTGVGGDLFFFGTVTTQSNSVTATISVSALYCGGVEPTFTIAQGTTANGIDLDVSSALAGFGLIKAGPGAMRLSGDNTFTSGVALNDGTLIIGNNNALGTGTLTAGGGALAADNNGPYTVSNAVSLSNTLTVSGGGSFTLAGPISGSGGLTKTGSGVLTLSGIESFTGPININGGTLVMNTSLSSNVTNSATFVYNNGTFGGRLTNLGTVVLNADFTAGNGMENDGNFALATGQTVTLNGAGLDNEGTFTMTGGTLNLNPAGSNVNRGNFSLSANLGLGGATLTNSGSLNLNGGLISGATGSLVNSTDGIISGTGMIESPFNNSGGVLAVGIGTTNITPAFSNSGTIQLTGVTSELRGGAITNTGTIQGLGLVGNATTNTGTIEALGGTLSVSGTLLNSAGGLLTADAGSKLFITSGLAVNHGVINLTGGIFDNGGHALNNASNGQVSGFGIFRTGGTGLDNHGSITFTGGLTTVDGPVTNENGQTITVAQNPAIFTGLVINNVGGTFNTANTTATFAGGFTNNGNSNFVKAGNGVVEVAVAPTLNNGSTLSVTTGTLRFNVVSGSATIGAGVTATVSSGATLELAGSVSALANGSNRVNVLNNSTSAGILVSGTHQQVGNIDGSGTTQVNAGSDLTANHIIQGALIIGGTKGIPGLVTIGASDASGNPLSQSSGFALADSVTPSGPFGAGGISSGSLLSDSASNGLGSSPTSLGSPTSAVGVAAVPEPSTILLSALALLSLLGLGIRRPINDAQVA